MFSDYSLWWGFDACSTNAPSKSSPDENAWGDVCGGGAEVLLQTKL